MQFGSDFIEQIKEKNSIFDIITKRISLQKKGDRYLGLCPFHTEKTPSFSVNDIEGYYYCFGCQAKGDHISFLMEVEKMSFEDSVEYLAKQAGMKLPETRVIDVEKQKQFKTLQQVVQMALDWFVIQLEKTSGNPAFEYIKSRKIDLNIIKKFKIGFAPNLKNALYQYLLSCSVDLQLIIDAGLAIRLDSGEVIDKFRNRIIFPIFNYKGEVIAFGGRSMGDIQPKYLNSPETKLFKKSEVLYAANFAKQAIQSKKRVIVVEGYIDAISLAQFGFEESVATLGTAFTISHLQMLWKLCKEPIICLDGDKAGINAMNKIALLAISNLEEEKTLNFVLLPKDSDPDEFLHKVGAANFEDFLSKARPLSEVVWDVLQNSQKVDTPEQISDLEKKCFNLVSGIKSFILKKNYEDFFRQKIWSLKRRKGEKKSKYLSPKNIATSDYDVVNRSCNILLAYILNHVNYLQNPKIREEFINVDFNEERFNNIRAIILDNLQNINDQESVKSLLTTEGFQLDYEFLCGDKSEFVDNISKNGEEYGILVWELLYQRYLFFLVEKEYKLNISNLNNTEKLFALQKELQNIQNYINQLESRLHDQ